MQYKGSCNTQILVLIGMHIYGYIFILYYMRIQKIENHTMGIFILEEIIWLWINMFILLKDYNYLIIRILLWVKTVKEKAKGVDCKKA